MATNKTRPLLTFQSCIVLSASCLFLGLVYMVGKFLFDVDEPKVQKDNKVPNKCTVFKRTTIGEKVTSFYKSPVGDLPPDQSTKDSDSDPNAPPFPDGKSYTTIPEVDYGLPGREHLIEDELVRNLEQGGNEEQGGNGDEGNEEQGGDEGNEEQGGDEGSDNNDSNEESEKSDSERTETENSGENSGESSEDESAGKGKGKWGWDKREPPEDEGHGSKRRHESGGQNDESSNLKKKQVGDTENGGTKTNKYRRRKNKKKQTKKSNKLSSKQLSGKPT